MLWKEEGCNSEQIELGVKRISSIPSNFKLSDSLQINDTEILTELASIAWPNAHLDFETLKTAVPPYPEVAPHEQLVPY